MKSQIQTKTEEEKLSAERERARNYMRERRKKLTPAQREKYLEYQRSYNHKHYDGLTEEQKRDRYEKSRAWEADNKEHMLKWRRKWEADNKEHMLKWRREYIREYRKTYTPTKKTQIGMKFRYWIHNAMKRKGESKTAWIDNVGCTKEEFKAHIESQFVEGMTWDNWTVDGWHIDHIIPLAAAGSNHYTNLQPLWWYDNLSKSDKIV